MAITESSEIAANGAVRRSSFATAARRAGIIAAQTVGWLLGPIVLLGAVLVLFRPAIVDGMIYYRPDTVLYYFPLANRFMEVLHQGQLMLWTPYLFGGFPLFADGEVGMLYPPNVLANMLLPTESAAFIWLAIARYLMGGIFTYGYLRALRLNGFAATIGALSFSFGSFMIAQMAHSNVVTTAIWLPLTLMFVELAVGNTRRKRWIYATLAGASTGVQALGLHIQPLIMSGFFLAFYIPFRVLLCPLAWPGGNLSRRLTAVLPVEEMEPGVVAKHGPNGAHQETLAAPVPRKRSIVRGTVSALACLRRDFPGRAARFARRAILPWSWRHTTGVFHRVVLAGLLLALIPAIAFGLAAAQVIPLVELGMFSFRGQGVNYQFSTSFSLPVQNLVNLLFPYFFRYTNQQYYWSLWSEWECALYVGIAPLVLATVALVFARRRLVLFFAAMTGVSLILAFGGYSPYPLWDQIRHLPGFSSLRVPARFTMITTFSLAVLAAFGADWLCRTLVPAPRSAVSRWRRLSRFAGTQGFALYLIGLLAAIAGVAWWLASFRIWIEKDPVAVKALIQQSYLSLRNDRLWLTPDQVLSFLSYTLDPTNPKTATSLALMLATFVLLFAWFAFRRLWRLWASALVVLVAADMLIYAMDFHPTMSVTQLATPDAAARWLMEQNRGGLARVYTTPGVRRTEPNKLLPFKIPEVLGYSSLQTKRHTEFMAKAMDNQRPFLDLYGTRFVVMPRNPVALPSYRYVGYNPGRPLADGPRDGMNANATFYMNPPVRTDEVLLISNLRDAVKIPQGAVVAEIAVTDTSGERVRLAVRAGVDTAEWAIDRPDVIPHVVHNRPEVAARLPVVDDTGNRFQGNLYFGDLKLDRTRTVQRVEFHYTYPAGFMRAYGMALWENPSTAHQVLSRYRYIPRYQDDEVAIMENPSALPHAFMVPGAKVVKPYDVLETMAHGDFAPEKVALLEPPQMDGPLKDEGGADDRVLQWLKGNDGSSPGKASIQRYASSEVLVKTSTERNSLLFMSDSYYPGWKALVDGQEEKIYRADYLFRAVPVPAGEHEVRFVYEPDSFAIGMDISRFTVAALALLWVGLLIVPPALRFWRPIFDWLRRRRLTSAS